LKKKLKIVVPIILGVFFLYITYRLTSQEERELILKYIKSAKIEFILAAMFFGAFADIIRGLRWQLLSKSIGYKTNPIISVASVFMCYTSNMAIARLVESFFNTNMLYFINDNITLISLFIILVSLIFVFFLKKSRWIRSFFKGILEGLLSITKLNSNLIFFILFSLMIWSCYILAFYMIKFSVFELSYIDSNLIFPAFVVGVYSISLSNHGLGVYPLAISLFLANFGINAEIGLTYGWLAWSCQAIITLIFGALSFFVLPLLNTSD